MPLAGAAAGLVAGFLAALLAGLDSSSSEESESSLEDSSFFAAAGLAAGTEGFFAGCFSSSVSESSLLEELKKTDLMPTMTQTVHHRCYHQTNPQLPCTYHASSQNLQKQKWEYLLSAKPARFWLLSIHL